MAPANPVDRTVQQAGKHRNKDKPKNPWTNKKNWKNQKIIWKKHKNIGKKNEKNGKHIKHTNSLERGCFREESLIFFWCFVFPLFFICPRVFPMFFVFPFSFFLCVSFFWGGGSSSSKQYGSNLRRHPSKSMQTIFRGLCQIFV